MQTNTAIQNHEANPVTTAARKRHSQRPLFRPRADIRETADAIHIALEVPGVARADVDISLEGNVLSVEAHSNTSGPEGYRLLYREFEHGSYRRRFTVSNTIDRDAISATLEQGILHLTLGKRPEPQPQKITING